MNFMHFAKHLYFTESKAYFFGKILIKNGCFNNENNRGFLQQNFESGFDQRFSITKPTVGEILGSCSLCFFIISPEADLIDFTILYYIRPFMFKISKHFTLLPTSVA